MPGLWPEFAARDQRFRAECSTVLGWEPGHTRTVANYAEQKSLYDRWMLPPSDPNHYNAPSVANPDATGYPSPWGWVQHGSWHQEQRDDPDHCGYAIDYQWPGGSSAEQRANAQLAHPIAAKHGIGFPVDKEDWHGQPFDWRGIYIDHVGAPPASITEDDVSLTIHYPTTRPNEPGVWDFQYLPASGSKVGAATVSTTVTVRQTPNTGVPVLVTVFFDGDPHTVTVPGDGRTATIDVTTAGLCSIVAAGVHVEAREFWS